MVEEFGTMKKLCVLLFLALAAVMGTGFLKIGSPAPEFGKGVWTKGRKVTLASFKGKQMVAILFWKPEHSSALAMQAFSRFAHQVQRDPVACVAVAEGTLQNIVKFPLVRQLGTIPLMVEIGRAHV